MCKKKQILLKSGRARLASCMKSEVHVKYYKKGFRKCGHMTNLDISTVSNIHMSPVGEVCCVDPCSNICDKQSNLVNLKSSGLEVLSRISSSSN